MDEFIDVTARADVLEAARDSLKTLLSKANTVEDVLRVQQEMNQLTESIESRRQRALQLKKDSEFSTLSLFAEALPTDHLPWEPFQMVGLAVKHMSAVGVTSMNALLYLLVWSIPLGLLAISSHFLFFRKKITGRN